MGEKIQIDWLSLASARHALARKDLILDLDPVTKAVLVHQVEFARRDERQQERTFDLWKQEQSCSLQLSRKPLHWQEEPPCHELIRPTLPRQTIRGNSKEKNETEKRRDAKLKVQENLEQTSHALGKREAKMNESLSWDALPEQRKKARREQQI